jgi:predicted N-acetyltransferase YhbS
VIITNSLPIHEQAIEALLDYVFGLNRLSRTAYRLREKQKPVAGLSFISTHNARLCGTISFWPIVLGDVPALLLGPIAVAHDFRGLGCGQALITRGLDTAKAQGHDIVMLVGDLSYYYRFGFSNTHTAAWKMPGPVDQQRVLALSLQNNSMLSSCVVTAQA